MHRIILISACGPLAFLPSWWRLSDQGGKEIDWEKEELEEKKYKQSSFKKRVKSKVSDKTRQKAERREKRRKLNYKLRQLFSIFQLVLLDTNIYGTSLNSTQRRNQALNRPLSHHRHCVCITSFNYFKYCVFI